MARNQKGTRAHRQQSRKAAHQARSVRRRVRNSVSNLPATAHYWRGPVRESEGETFNAPEVWHQPAERSEIHFVRKAPGAGYIHPVSVQEVRDRIAELPSRFTRRLEVVQFSPMTRKRAIFPCYGMQWGPNVYLYPIEESLVETYVRSPSPAQQVEARMFGGRWEQDGKLYRLRWTERTIKDFYLNNVLIHEIGHVVDDRNTNSQKRERYADWFAIEYGYRATRGRR
mgnify:CR=1 FL=1